MAKGFEFQRKKDDITEVKKNIEIKKNEYEKLSEQKNSLSEALTLIDGSSYDESVKNVIKDSLNRSLEENKRKAEELATDMNADLSKLENIKIEAQGAIDDTKKDQQKLEDTKKALDRFGIGGALDKGISDLSTHQINLEALTEDDINTMKELEQVSLKFRTI